MHEESNEVPEHRHPELERMIIEQTEHLLEDLLNGFDAVRRAIREGSTPNGHQP